MLPFLSFAYAAGPRENYLQWLRKRARFLAQTRAAFFRGRATQRTSAQNYALHNKNGPRLSSPGARAQKGANLARRVFRCGPPLPAAHSHGRARRRGREITRRAREARQLQRPRSRISGDSVRRCGGAQRRGLSENSPPP